MSEQMNLDGLFEDALDAAIDTTRIHPGDGEGNATIEKFELKVVEAKRGKNAGKSFVVCDFYYRLHDWRIDGIDQMPQVKSGIIVDVNAAGKLDTGVGKNRQLGLILEAAGLNTDKPRQADLFGSTVFIKYKTETDEAGNTNTNVIKWAPAL